MDLWKSGFFGCAKMYVMQKKLSLKERKEPVTKGFLADFLADNEYITRTSLEEILDSKNYATKEYVFDMFTSFRKLINEDFGHHTQSLIEMIRHENRLIVESIMSRVERVERFVEIPSDF